MIAFPTPILGYWRRIFENGTVIAGSEALWITVNPALNQKRQTIILDHASGPAQAALTPALAERIGVDEMLVASAAGLRQRLTDHGVTIHDPDLIFYLPAAPLPVGADSPLPVSRQLTEADREAFDRFQATASEQDLGDAYVELITGRCSVA